jgi:hypothetical protein
MPRRGIVLAPVKKFLHLVQLAGSQESRALASASSSEDPRSTDFDDEVYFVPSDDPNWYVRGGF